jgi:hypothetical protein
MRTRVLFSESVSPALPEEIMLSSEIFLLCLDQSDHLKSSHWNLPEESRWLNAIEIL